MAGTAIVPAGPGGGVGGGGMKQYSGRRGLCSAMRGWLRGDHDAVDTRGAWLALGPHGGEAGVGGGGGRPRSISASLTAGGETPGGPPGSGGCGLDRRRRRRRRVTAPSLLHTYSGRAVIGRRWGGSGSGAWPARSGAVGRASGWLGRCVSGLPCVAGGRMLRMRGQQSGSGRGERRCAEFW